MFDLGYRTGATNQAHSTSKVGARHQQSVVRNLVTSAEERKLREMDVVEDYQTCVNEWDDVSYAPFTVCLFLYIRV